MNPVIDVEMTPLAMRKLAELQDNSYTVNGVCFERVILGSTTPDRGFIDMHGFVGWHRPAALDWSQIARLVEVANSAEVRQFTTGTTNWAAAVCRAMGASK